MLMEIMITIAIVGLMLVPVFMMQSSTFRALSRYSSRMRLLFSAKNSLIQEIDKEHATKKLSEKQGQKEGVERSKVDQSLAFKNIKNLYKHTVKVRSSRGQKESIIGFTYKPGQEKK